MGTFEKSRCTHVVRFHVTQNHSGYGISGGGHGKYLKVAYTATLFLDASTMNVRRISIEAEDLPPSFPIHESLIAIDYDFVSMSGREYLLPQQAVLFLRDGPRSLKKNEIKFLDYRRFGAVSTFRP